MTLARRSVPAHCNVVGGFEQQLKRDRGVIQSRLSRVLILGSSMQHKPAFCCNLH